MKLLFLIGFSLIAFGTAVAETVDDYPAKKVPKKSSLFSSLPFLPKPQFKPEKYMKSARHKRSIAFRMPGYTIYRPIQVRSSLRPAVATVNPSAFNFQGLNFNNVFKPMPDPSKRPFDGPVVVPIIGGNYSIGDNRHLFSASVTLIIDENVTKNERCYILVDTGLPIFKNTLIGGLAAHGIRLQDIQTLILTHPDVDAMGNLNLFPHTDILMENKKTNRQFVYIQKSVPLFDRTRSGLPYVPLCDNTDVFLTPGMSVRDLSLVVKNVADYGTIAVVGSLIFDEFDLKTNISVKTLAFDEDQKKLWEATRLEMVCLADFIVPGYGLTFRVTPQMKADFGCSKRVSFGK